MRKVKNLIFDLGGVIINIDPELTIEGFRKEGILDIDTVYVALKEAGYLLGIETGEISFEELYAAFIARSDHHIEKGKFIKCWNTLLLDIPEERVALLRTLREKYSLYLLSNTNPIHMDAIHNYVEKNFSLKLADLFDKVYLSYEHAACKPDHQIFIKILEENGLLAEETIFFDDVEMHLIAAGSLGINTAWVTAENSINDLAVKLNL